MTPLYYFLLRLAAEALLSHTPATTTTLGLLVGRSLFLLDISSLYCLVLLLAVCRKRLVSFAATWPFSTEKSAVGFYEEISFAALSNPNWYVLRPILRDNRRLDS